MSGSPARPEDAPRFTPAAKATTDVLKARILVAFTYPHGHPGVPGLPEGEGCPRCNAEAALAVLLAERDEREQALRHLAEQIIEFAKYAPDADDAEIWLAGIVREAQVAMDKLAAGGVRSADAGKETTNDVVDVVPSGNAGGHGADADDSRASGLGSADAGSAKGPKPTAWGQSLGALPNDRPRP